MTVTDLVPSLVYLSLTAVHRRGWGNLYDALAVGTMDESAIRTYIGQTKRIILGKLVLVEVEPLHH